jgi:hypothetical protein
MEENGRKEKKMAKNERKKVIDLLCPLIQVEMASKEE